MVATGAGRGREVAAPSRSRSARLKLLARVSKLCISVVGRNRERPSKYGAVERESAIRTLFLMGFCRIRGVEATNRVGDD